MTVADFIESNKLNYTKVNITGLNEKGKKVFDGPVQLKGIKTMSYEECRSKNEKILSYNQLYINLDNLKNIIVIDTDEKEAYDITKNFLSEIELYDNDYITSSYKCRKLGLKYKKHFWLQMDNHLNFNDLVFQEYKLKNSDDKEIGDLRINSGVIGEFKDIDMDFDTLPIISRKEFDTFSKLLNIPLRFKVNKDVKIEPPKEKIKKLESTEVILNEIGMENKINNETLRKILDNLDIKRFDNYDYWLIMAMIFVNEKLDFDIFEEYSKKSSKFNKDSNSKIISGLRKNINGYSINTLFLWLKEDDFETFQEVNKNRVDFWGLLKNINQNDLAKFYYNLMPNKYVRCNKDGWFEYNNNNILNNTGDVPPSLLNNISNILQDTILEQRNFLKPNENFYKDKMRLINSSFKMVGNSKFICGVIDYLKNYYTIDDLYKKIDNNKDVIAFKNCLFDLSIGTFRDIKPNDFISKNTGYNINKKSNQNIRSELEKILEDIFINKKMINFYKYVMGSSFFSNKSQLIYIHTGSGGNGKGILFDLLKATLGDYYYNTDNKFLTEVKQGANSNLANARGRRILGIQEPEGEFLNVEFIKIITGEKEITTRELYKSNMTFDVLFTPHLQCNIKPKLNKLDGGIIRRLRIIKYNTLFVDKPVKDNERKKDYNLRYKLANVEYINEYMLMLLDHINKWKNIDISDIEVPQEVIDETDEYINENNFLKNYLDNHIIITNDTKDKVKCSELFDHYINNDNNEGKLNHKTFANNMVANKLDRYKIDGIYYYRGLILKKTD